MTDRILVTGARGFLGRNLMPMLIGRFGPERVVGVSRRDYDLENRDQVERMLRDVRPDVVVHLAAYVGGIGANKAYPATFYYRNILLQAHLFAAAADAGIRKLVYPIGGCSYPALATSPIDEGQMWNGMPQAESAPYSSVKKMGLIASSAYADQFGLRSVVIVPGNMYGPYDNFRHTESHVIPALVRRFVEAKLAGSPEVVIWGTGRAVRDFVYVGDVAAMIPFFIAEYDGSGPVNISTGAPTTIRELAEEVRRATGYSGRIVWDSSKPEGQLEKVFAVTRMRELGLRCDTSLRDGLRLTVEWFCRNYASNTDGIRL